MLKDAKQLKAFYITTDKISGNEFRSLMPDLVYEIVDGFDFRDLPREIALKKINRMSFLIKYGTLPSNGAIGCALAHRYCYEQMLCEGFDNALILEDDVAISSIDLKSVSDTINEIADFDVINLLSLDAVITRKPAGQVSNCAIHRSVYYCYNAAAYIVSRKGAEKLRRAQHPQVTGFADWPIHAWRMKIYLTVPSSIVLTGRPTGVQTKIPEQLRLPYFISVTYQIRRLIWRTIALVRFRAFGDLHIEVAQPG